MNKLAGWVLLLFLAGASTEASTIFSTFAPGPGDFYDTCCAFGNVSPYEIAYPFTVPATSNFSFTSGKLALSQGIGSVNAVDISLTTDASDQPGTVLESFHLVNALGIAGASNPPVLVSSTLNPILLAGGRYWLIESPSAAGNGVNWHTAYIMPTPPQRASRSSGSSAWTVSTVDVNSFPGAFSISADPVTAAAVPEPETLILLFCGALGLGLVRLSGIVIAPRR
jgi:hypothetical protein